MTDDTSTTPIEIRSPKGASTTEILWADGHLGLYPHVILRGYCPCATCQGHHGPVRFQEGGDLWLADIEEVGSYAVRLVWGDGHGTGLYSFRFLRELCACERCGGAFKDRVFGR